MASTIAQSSLILILTMATMGCRYDRSFMEMNSDSGVPFFGLQLSVDAGTRPGREPRAEFDSKPAVSRFRALLPRDSATWKSVALTDADRQTVRVRSSRPASQSTAIPADSARTMTRGTPESTAIAGAIPRSPSSKRDLEQLAQRQSAL